MQSPYDAYDAALEWLAPFGPDLAWGFTSHAPMVAEALCAMDRGDAVRPWLEAHREGLLPRPQPSAPVDARRWRDALGKPERWADWTALFERELAAAPLADVLARWVPRLAPGLAAAAAHGVIRAGHAARALARGDTDLRRRELAAGLGYWAATWQRLPASDRPLRAPVRPLEALARVPRIVASRPPSASIVEAFLALEDCPEFALVAHDLDLEGPLDAAIGALGEAFARVFLANARDRLGAIVFTHGVTGVAALRALAAYLPEEEARRALRFAWQTGAALVATFASAEPVAAPVTAPGLAPAALIDAAVRCGDDHAIKLTEACLAEHARNPSPVFLAAARQGVERLTPPAAGAA